ncbi:MAG: MBL fold metallo-hydrolase [Acidimicrobiia bacterium]
MITETLYDDGTRSWRFIGRKSGRDPRAADPNEYLVVDGSSGLVLHPGGGERFANVIGAVSRIIATDRLVALFASRQDPEVLSALSRWAKVCPGARVFVPRAWETFTAFFGIAAGFELIPDEGGPFPLGASTDLRFVPAHYLHSPANFSVYDPVARILFTGDIGSAPLPPEQDVFVQDFDRHIGSMEGFHRRWMPSEAARDRWLERVRGLHVDLLCPHHGPVFVGHDVDRFFEWFSGLELGGAIAV